MTFHCSATQHSFRSPAVRQRLLSEKIFGGITLSNLTFVEDFLRNEISNKRSVYTELRGHSTYLRI